MEVGLPYKKAAAEPYTIIFDCVWLFFCAFFQKTWKSDYHSQYENLGLQWFQYNKSIRKNLKKTGFCVLTIRKKFFENTPSKHPANVRIVKDHYFRRTTPTNHAIFLLILDDAIIKVDTDDWKNDRTKRFKTLPFLLDWLTADVAGLVKDAKHRAAACPWLSPRQMLS